MSEIERLQEALRVALKQQDAMEAKLHEDRRFAREGIAEFTAKLEGLRGEHKAMKVEVKREVERLVAERDAWKRRFDETMAMLKSFDRDFSTKWLVKAKAFVDRIDRETGA